MNGRPNTCRDVRLQSKMLLPKRGYIVDFPQRKCNRRQYTILRSLMLDDIIDLLWTDDSSQWRSNVEVRLEMHLNAMVAAQSRRPHFLFKGICRALEADPQGGASSTPTTFGICSHDINKVSPSGVVRSARTTDEMAFFERILSTPKLLLIPICLRAAVTLALPAKIPTTRQSLRDAPPFAS